MKLCSKCGEHKSIAEFGLDPKNIKGRSHQCKACARAYSREWGKRRKANRNTWPLTMLAQVKRRAKNAGIEFNLTVDDLVVPERCLILRRWIESIQAKVTLKAMLP